MSRGTTYNTYGMDVSTFCTNGKDAYFLLSRGYLFMYYRKIFLKACFFPLCMHPLSSIVYQNITTYEYLVRELKRQEGAKAKAKTAEKQQDQVGDK